MFVLGHHERLIHLFFCASLAIQRVAFTIGMTGSTVDSSDANVLSFQVVSEIPSPCSRQKSELPLGCLAISFESINGAFSVRFDLNGTSGGSSKTKVRTTEAPTPSSLSYVPQSPW